MNKAEIAGNAADQILALINAQPRTPSKEDIAEVLLQALSETSNNVAECYVPEGWNLLVGDGTTTSWTTSHSQAAWSAWTSSSGLLTEEPYRHTHAPLLSSDRESKETIEASRL